MTKIILFIVALSLFTIAFIPAILFIAFDAIDDVLFKIALVIDMAGNVLLAGMFNKILITQYGYQFGNKKETISSVLGKNKVKRTLKPLGKKLADLLDWIDKGHCLKSIDYNV